MALAGQGAQALAFASSGLTSFALQAACVGGGRFLASIASGEATSRATSSAPGSTQGSVTARTATSASEPALSRYPSHTTSTPLW